MTSLKISILPLILGAAVSNVAMAQTDCSNYGDDSQRIEKTVNFEPALELHHNHRYWNRDWNHADKVDFDFGYSNIDNINDVMITVSTRNTHALWGSDKLFFPIEGMQSVVDYWRGNGIAYFEAYQDTMRESLSPYETYPHSEEYRSELKQGKLKLGILYVNNSASNNSDYAIEVKSVQVSFCGVVKDDIAANDDSQKLDAARNNLLTEQGEAVQHYLDANITYRATVTGAASDQNGNAISSVSVNYIDPRSQKNITKQLSDNQEYYLHSDGQVSLYYTNGNEHNTGGHTVKLERVNLD
ncbi:hypothetical protein MHN79_14380 [Vibrio sp. Of14-4]|uniref:hypothetical protein n=1 Tax=Vibrio sp. Of14-4 TaxID=2724878 RepID=UPI001EF3A6CB|nr:hypothetical protein [Vibrio sp. Of14-4]MCG7490675.1 hypothetical protein [Vibrio sp. Of14-4]